MIRSEILEQLKITEEDLIKHLDHDVHEIFSTMAGIEISPATVVDTETVFSSCVTAMV